MIIYLRKNLIIKLHHICFPLILFIIGVINSYYDNTSFFKVFFQCSAISVCLVVFYNSFSLYYLNKNDADKNFASNYNLIITIYVLVSLFIFLLKKSFTDDPQIRLYGLLAEPSVLALVVIPALLYSLKKMILKFNLFDLFLCIIFTFTIFQTKSTLGYFGLLTLPFFLIDKIKVKLVFLVLVLVILFFSINFVPLISYKVNELYRMFSDNNLYSFNGPTSVTFYINFIIAIKSFIANPIFGNGLGSHAVSYFENVYNIPGAQSYPTSLYIGLNYNDANSLFFRIISETGLLGIGFLFYYLIKYYIPSYSSNMSLILISLMLVRNGNFINPEFFLFVYYYYFSKLNSIKNNTSK